MSKRRDREPYDAVGEVSEPEAVDVETVEAPMPVPPIEPNAVASGEYPGPAPQVVVKEPSAAMALRVFATLAGPKWDQMAGFVSYAGRHKLGPMSMEEWQAAFVQFQNRAVS
jgi:hypothetical protein